ncbi:dihydropteroate synthase [Halomicrococcus gelatinilyticus]|uniref:dihydropteroate synthase n=1 Tax=Halomicrococcus gelatinilyticus TaxID=1702103 RepID=UPI002E14CB29
MEYHEAVNRLERLQRLRPKLGTETTAAMLGHLDDPHESVTAVQVAGSNGKGSTARTLARILREAGHDVGLYTSPDLNDVRERVRVGGRKIPKAEVVRFVEATWPYVVDRSVEGDPPTFFEALTVMALWHFGRKDVDVAVLEVGIGGKYDATSVVDPAAAAVTNVSLEHTDIIGSTVEEIARDKCTVAPADAPLVTGATGTALRTIREETPVVTVGGERDDDAAADDRDVESSGSAAAGPPAHADVVTTETGMVSRTESSVSIVGDGWEVQTRTSLLGQHQAENAAIAATLARQVAGATPEDVAAGIRNVSWPGRFEVMDDDPLVVLDGAHNPDACSKLAALLLRYDYDDLHVVFGAMRDKDHAAMRDALPRVDRLYLGEPAVDRAQGTDTLRAVFERGSDAAVETFGSVPDALERALWQADESDCVLVTGSLYTVAEARDRWTRTPRVVNTADPERARAVTSSADVPEATRRATADRMVDRTVRFHARSAVAATLKEEMLSLGGTCVVSGVEHASQHVEVVLSGTRDQFVDLVREFSGRAGEKRRLAEQVNDALGIGVDAPDGDHPWTDGTAVMGILNVTPDSFHDGGAYDATADAVARAREMVAAGADVVDVGGESTRPGADPVAADVEIERVVPVLERLTDLDATISVDTRKPSVASAALDAGADMVNDVAGLADASMRRVVADHDVPAVCMHSLSAPVDPDTSYEYGDVVSDVLDDLTERVLLAERAGIDRSQLIVDPGLGFGKRPGESFALLDRLAEFEALGTPVMVGHSHKSMFERVASDPDDRFAPTVAATALAAERGADVVRVHDVAANAAAVRTAERTVGDRER